MTTTCRRCGATYTAMPPRPLRKEFPEPYVLEHRHLWSFSNGPSESWVLLDARGVYLMIGAGHWGDVFEKEGL